MPVVDTERENYVDSLALFVALAVFAITALSSATLTPVLLGLYVDSVGISARIAGWVTSGEAAGLLVAQIAFSAAGYRWNRRALALTSVSITASGNLATLFVHLPLELAAARFVAGVGAGLAIAVLSASFASRKNPQRACAASEVIALAYAAGLLAISGRIAQQGGLTAVMLVVVGLNALGGCACAWIPATLCPVERDKAVSLARVPPTSSRTRMAIVRLTMSMLLLYAGHNALWTYQERMGMGLGLTRTNVGILLGTSVAGGVAGAMLAAVLETKKGVLIPSLASYIVLIAAALAIAGTHATLPFILAAVLLKTAWFFGLPYLQAALARLDASGRAVVLGGVFQTLGSAVGIAGAAAIVPYGYSGVGMLSTVLYLLCIPLSAGVLTGIDRAFGSSARSSLQFSKPR